MRPAWLLCQVSIRHLARNGLRCQVYRFSRLFSQAASVKTLTDDNIETFRKEAFGKSEPAILSQISQCPLATSRWFHHIDSASTFNESYLAAYSSHTIPVEISEHDSGGQVTSFRRLQLPLGVFIEYSSAKIAHTQHRQLYVAQASLEDLPDSLLKDLVTPTLVANTGKGDVYGSSIWLGRNPTYTPLHRDPNPNMFIQLAGKKFIRLLEPDVGQSVYDDVQRRVGGDGYSHYRGEEMMSGSERNILDQMIWHSNLCGRPVEANLQPGDALFIPKGWWHSVKGVGGGVTGSVRPFNIYEGDETAANITGQLVVSLDLFLMKDINIIQPH
ncbi:MAG: hypothetical protein M1814_002742 [Vezdaea aestivalis]|nr:MAG: hypothetical protein M1814_002742 [Vezdaea aestivalis]